MSAIDFLRDVGKHFRVNKMITKDAVSARLHSEQGISLHRVQLPAAAGAGLPRAAPAPRLRPAVRGQRPVGQPHRRAGPDPPGRGRAGARVRHAAADPCRRDQVRQDRGRRRCGSIPELTSPYAFYQFWLNTDDRDVVDLPEGAVVPRPARRSRRSRRPSPSGRRRARRSARSPRSSPRWCTGRRSATRWSPPARRCSAAGSCRTRRRDPRRVAGRAAARPR